LTTITQRYHVTFMKTQWPAYGPCLKSISQRTPHWYFLRWLQYSIKEID
jgi:hypothetical protein